jgi:hypothetical protein
MPPLAFTFAGGESPSFHRQPFSQHAGVIAGATEAGFEAEGRGPSVLRYSARARNHKRMDGL